MRVLYGVVGCGLGHAMRAQVVLEHLRARGHDTLAVSSGRALELLEARGHACLAVQGMQLEYVRGEVSRVASAAAWLEQAPRAVRQGLGATLDAVRRFDPQVVITDFELFACVAGHLLGRPIISIDHQHVIDRCEHPRSIRRRVRSFGLLRATCALKTAGCARYVVSSFYFPSQRRPRTTLVGPLLRPALERARPSKGEHVIVYQTTPNDPLLIPALQACRDARFVVYGRGCDAEQGNVTLRRFDEPRFIEELASARAVITNGGFTTIGEALALGKPVLAVPVAHQPEQALNAAWLEELGWGRACARLTPGAVQSFLRCDFARPSDARLRSGRRDACAALDEALEGETR